MEARGPGPRTDHPRSNRDPTEIDRKLGLLRAPHVAALTEYVERLRARRGVDAVPYFDPTEAGVAARILLLLEAPGPRATAGRGSGFISADNNDASAENLWRLLRETGVDRATEVVTWSIVPWYVGDAARIRPVVPLDLEQARPTIEELLTLLPELRVIVLLGKQAARGWRDLGIGFQTIAAPHPSPKNLNTRPAARAEIQAALVEGRQLAGLSESIK